MQNRQQSQQWLRNELMNYSAIYNDSLECQNTWLFLIWAFMLVILSNYCNATDVVLSRWLCIRGGKPQNTTRFCLATTYTNSYKNANVVLCDIKTMGFFLFLFSFFFLKKTEFLLPVVWIDGWPLSVPKLTIFYYAITEIYTACVSLVYEPVDACYLISLPVPIRYVCENQTWWIPFLKMT